MRSTRRRARRSGVALVALAVAAPLSLTFTSPVFAHEKFDHPAPALSGTNTPFEYLQQGGEGATWEAITSIPTGNAHTDLEFFTKGEETYASVGTLAAGGNQGGQSIVQLTEDGEVVSEDGDAAPMFVAGHPSATCVTNPRSATGLQHDVEATPKGDTISNDSYLPETPEDVQLIIDATDAAGRCHDQGRLGLAGAPLGGLEIIDVTGLGEEDFEPKEIALTSHVGQSHTVNIDPARPHIAYSVTSDQVSVTENEDGSFTRNNEIVGGPQRFNLDGFEVVDISSCMYQTDAVPAGTLDPAIQEMSRDEAVEAKREACKPEVFRYRYEDLAPSQGHTIKTGIFGCHELAIYPDDRLTCGSGAAAIVFDMSGAFDENDKPVGEPLDCRLRPSTSEAGFETGAMITDCVNGGTDEEPKPLDVPAWLADGAPSLEGVEHLGSQHHIGRAPTDPTDPTNNFATTIPATEDIDFNHETEFTQSGRFLLATDERGGGVLGGAQCTQGESNEQVNGGVHAYRVDRLTTEPATTAERADEGYAMGFTGDPDNPVDKSIFRARTRTGAEGTFCTAHVLQQVPDQNRIFMGWYTQGTQVIDSVELPNGMLQFIEAGFGIPAGGNTWVSHVFKMDEEEDGSFTYFGANGDLERGGIDVFSVNLPAPLTACDLESGTADRSEPSTVSDRDQSREVHKQAVDCVLNYKISKGKTANADGTPATYAPREDVSREQMASFIVNAIEASGAGDSLPAARTSREAFTDVTTDLHRDSINRLAEAGIVRGVGGGRFDPLAKITRAQMASFIVEAARVANDTALEPERRDQFGDVPPGNVHERNISAGFEAGLFQGTVAPGAAPRSGEFSPRVNVPRDQMASFLVNLFTQSIQ